MPKKRRERKFVGWIILKTAAGMLCNIIFFRCRAILRVDLYILFSQKFSFILMRADFLVKIWSETLSLRLICAGQLDCGRRTDAVWKVGNQATVWYVVLISDGNGLDLTAEWLTCGNFFCSHLPPYITLVLYLISVKTFIFSASKRLQVCWICENT